MSSIYRPQQTATFTTSLTTEGQGQGIHTYFYPAQLIGLGCVTYLFFGSFILFRNTWLDPDTWNRRVWRDQDYGAKIQNCGNNNILNATDILSA